MYLYESRDVAFKTTGRNKFNVEGFELLPFLCEVHVLLGQFGEDLVENLVRVRLTRQGHVVLSLQGDRR